jgi:hypothetical protein
MAPMRNIYRHRWEILKDRDLLEDLRAFRKIILKGI